MQALIHRLFSKQSDCHVATCTISTQHERSLMHGEQAGPMRSGRRMHVSHSPPPLLLGMQAAMRTVLWLPHVHRVRPMHVFSPLCGSKHMPVSTHSCGCFPPSQTQSWSHMRFGLRAPAPLLEPWPVPAGGKGNKASARLGDCAGKAFTRSLADAVTECVTGCALYLCRPCLP